MSFNQRPTADVAILAGRVPFNNGLYVVGPFAERVSFAAQQRRALSLVWAIDEDLKHSGDDRGLKGKKVAVVGAGLAGLTATLALAAFEASVWVFEQQPQALVRMMRAVHRDIHPTINFWPREPLEVTTNLPFLNWFHDSCDRVLERIWTEWTLLRPENNLIKRVEYGCTLDRVHPKGGGWEIGATTADGRKLPRTIFDNVLLATGFGDERCIPGGEGAGYWDCDKDPVAPLIKEATSPCLYHVVSGTGDGGIIEVLRLLYGKFRAGTVEPGSFPLVRDQPLMDAISAIESEARRRVSDAILHAPEGLDGNAKDSISEYLWQEYAKLCQGGEISESVEAAMRASLTPVRKVILLGERKTPMEHTSSPYHKLLLCSGLLQGLVEYHRVAGEVIAADYPAEDPRAMRAQALGITLKSLSFTSAERIAVRDGAIARDLGPEPVALPHALFMCRHGYESPLERVLEHDRSVDVENVRTRQRLYGDQDWLSVEQVAHYASAWGLATPDEPSRWANRHWPMAQDFFRSRHSLEVIDITAVGNSRNPVYRVRSRMRMGEEEYRLAKARMPESFMGIPVELEQLGAVRTAPRRGHA